MSVLKYAIAAAVGYYSGQPGGQRQLKRLREQLTDLTSGPQAAQLKERGRTVANERVSAARGLVRRNRTDAATAPHTDGTAGVLPSPTEPGSGTAAGFDGRTVAEDSEAARKGITPPSPVARTAQEIRPTEQH